MGLPGGSLQSQPSIGRCHFGGRFVLFGLMLYGLCFWIIGSLLDMMLSFCSTYTEKEDKSVIIFVQISTGKQIRIRGLVFRKLSQQGFGCRGLDVYPEAPVAVAVTRKDILNRSVITRIIP